MIVSLYLYEEVIYGIIAPNQNPRQMSPFILISSLINFNLVKELC